MGHIWSEHFSALYVQCSALWNDLRPRGSVLTRDSNSCPPYKVLGALTKELASQLLVWVLAGFSTSQKVNGTQPCGHFSKTVEETETRFSHIRLDLKPNRWVYMLVYRVKLHIVLPLQAGNLRQKIHNLHANKVLFGNVRGASKIKLKKVNKRERLQLEGYLSQGIHCWSVYTVVFINTKLWRPWRRRQRR
jgi:hypothetical protein